MPVSRLAPKTLQRQLNELQERIARLEGENADLRRQLAECRDAELTLRETGQRYRTLAAQMSEGVLQVDNGDVIQYANDRFCELTGYSRAELIGRVARDLLLFEEDRPLMQQKAAAHRQGLTDQYEIRLKRKSGKTIWVLLGGAPLMDADGAVIGSVGVHLDITERKRAEAALRASEERYRDLVEHSRDLICTHDLRGRILGVNPAAARMLGYPAGAILSMNIRDILAPGVRDRFDAYVDAIRRDGEAGGLMRVQTRAGETRIWEYRNTLRTEGLDEPLVRGMARDVTDRKRAEAELALRLDQLHALYQISESLNRAGGLNAVHDAALDAIQSALHAARAAILLFDPDGVCRFKAWRGLSDDYRQAVEGHTPWPRDAVDPQPILVPDIARSTESEHIKSVVLREGIGAVGFIPLVQNRRLLGKFMIYFNAPRAFTDDDLRMAQAVAGHIAFALERQSAEAALREAESRYRMLVEEFPSVVHYIYPLAEDGPNLYVSPQIETLLGFSQAESTALPGLWATRLHPDDRERELARWRSCYAAGRPYSAEYRLLARDGRTVWVHNEAAPIRNASGDVTAYHGILIDITARREAEAELTHARSMISVLNAVGVRLQGSLVLDDVMNTLGGELKQMSVTCFVALMDPGSGALTLQYSSVDSRLVEMVERLTGWKMRGFRFNAQMLPYYAETMEQGRAMFVPDTMGVLTAILPEPLKPLLPDLISLTRIGGGTRGIRLPLTVHERVFGVLGLWGNNLREADIPAFAILASQAAIAIRNAQLYQSIYHSQKELEALSHRLVEAQESERRLVARELHDEVGQALTGVRIVLELAAQSPDAAAYLAEAQAQVSELTRRVQTLSLSLRPAMLDDLGLLPALLWHFERYTAQTGVEVNFQHGQVNRRFNSEIETAGYRIVQEALTNVARHAGVKSAAVRLWADPARLMVEVADAGRGFSPDELAASARHSTGLSSMRERAALLGGQCVIETGLGRGVRITAEIPLDEGAK